MYGTVMTARIKGSAEDLTRTMAAWIAERRAKGFVSEQTLLADDGTTVVQAVQFSSKEDYQALADDPAQATWWETEVQPLLDGDATWVDGTWIDVPGHSDVLRKGYAAFASGDIPAVLAVFSPDIVWTSPPTLPMGGVFRGHDEVLGFFQSLGGYYAELAVEPGRFIESGDDVVVLGQVRARTLSGTAIEEPFVHVWTMRDGRAVQFQEFFDTAAMNRALGRPAEIRLDQPEAAATS